MPHTPSSTFTPLSMEIFFWISGPTKGGLGCPSGPVPAQRLLKSEEHQDIGQEVPTKAFGNCSYLWALPRCSFPYFYGLLAFSLLLLFSFVNPWSWKVSCFPSICSKKGEGGQGLGSGLACFSVLYGFFSQDLCIHPSVLHSRATAPATLVEITI